MISLEKLKEAMMVVAREDTAYPPYIPERSLLHNHCGAVSYVVQQMLGGELVSGTVQGVRHIWNLLPNGEEVDLSACQFGHKGIKPIAKGKQLPPRKAVNPRYKKFASRVARHLTPASN